MLLTTKTKKLRLAIMFADISGSTQLYESLGDAAARLKVSECLQTISEVVKRNKGVVIKPIGDEIMSTFPNAELAMAAACEMQNILQQDVTEGKVSDEPSISIRVGLHYGPAILESGDVFGDAVNVAARMATQAKPGQIITTDVTVKKLPTDLQATTRLIDHAPIKGKKKAVDLYEVIWQENELTRLLTGLVDKQTPTVKLCLRYQDQEIELNDNQPSAILGRGDTADLLIDEPLASRQHVRLELRRGKFFIIDQSTNGTYVRVESGADVFLRKEEMPLSGDGMISLARSFTENPTEVVYFTHES